MRIGRAGGLALVVRPHPMMRILPLIATCRLGSPVL
jgi:hypothetical protein